MLMNRNNNITKQTIFGWEKKILIYISQLNNKNYIYNNYNMQCDENEKFINHLLLFFIFITEFFKNHSDIIHWLICSTDVITIVASKSVYSVRVLITLVLRPYTIIHN